MVPALLHPRGRACKLRRCCISRGLLRRRSRAESELRSLSVGPAWVLSRGRIQHGWSFVDLENPSAGRTLEVPCSKGQSKRQTTEIRQSGWLHAFGTKRPLRMRPRGSTVTLHFGSGSVPELRDLSPGCLPLCVRLVQLRTHVSRCCAGLRSEHLGHMGPYVNLSDMIRR